MDDMDSVSDQQIRPPCLWRHYRSLKRRPGTGRIRLQHSQESTHEVSLGTHLPSTTSRREQLIQPPHTSVVARVFQYQPRELARTIPRAKSA